MKSALLKRYNQAQSELILAWKNYNQTNTRRHRYPTEQNYKETNEALIDWDRKTEIVYIIEREIRGSYE